MGIELNRRALLGGIAASPVVLAIPASGAVVATPTDPGLAQCIAEYRKAAAATERFHRQVYKPAYSAWKAATDAVPHYTTRAAFKSIGSGDRPIHMTTASEVDCRAARDLVERGSKRGDDFTDCCRELAEALDRRDEELAAISERMQIEELAERDDEIADLTTAPLQAIEDFPVTTLADLIVKLTLVSDVLGDDLSAEAVIADLRRIAGEC